MCSTLLQRQFTIRQMIEKKDGKELLTSLVANLDIITIKAQVLWWNNTGAVRMKLYLKSLWI